MDRLNAEKADKKRKLSENRREGSLGMRNAGEMAIRSSSNNAGGLVLKSQDSNAGKPAEVKGPGALPPKASMLNKENLNNLGKKEENKVKEPVIEPIENYKGKSVEELEAILDAYNKAKKPPVEQPKPSAAEADKPPVPLPKR